MATILWRRTLSALTAIALALPMAAEAVVPYPTGAVAPLQVDALPSGFVASNVRVGEVGLHIVRGGYGARTVLLLHDWPETWYAWRKVLPALAARETVVVPDLRGLGGSTVPANGYDALTLARDIHGLRSQLGLGPVLVVGQGIGGTVAYAYARLYPDEVRAAVLLDTPLPGLGPWPDIRSAPNSWMMGFNADTDLAEALVQGREDVFLQGVFSRTAVVPQAITDDDRAVYLRSYRLPAHLKAGFELYRALPTAEAFDRQHTEAFAPPILLVGGDRGLGPYEEKIAADLAAHGVQRLQTAVIPDCGHWIAEEQPARLISLLASPFLDQDPGPNDAPTQ